LRLLLDTNALLWALMEPGRLCVRAAAALEDEASDVFVSIVSPWEMAIAKSRGKMNPPDDLEAQLDERRFSLLPVLLRHTQAVALLPGHHRDPFDRMLIAQAQTDGMTIVTSDRKLRDYPVSLLPAI
jgi:PIN domain nuclease of toxin-antitoxin system